MIKNFFFNLIFGSLISVLLILPVNAQQKTTNKDNPDSITTSVNLDKKDDKKIPVDKDFDRKIEDLNKLVNRVSEFKNIPDTDKQVNVLIINGLINSLNSLKFEIDNSSSTTTVKESKDLLAKNYRNYSLIIPQFNILASADRMKTMVSMMKIIEAKIQLRFSNIATSSQNFSKDKATIEKNLAVMSERIDKIEKLADEIIALVAPLNINNEDKSDKDTNLATLKQARTKIKEAHLNLVAAKKNADYLLELLIENSVKKIATSTSEINK